MNKQEACSILGVDPGASAEDIKKKYRDLTKQYHPDINKEPGAEEKFKSINQAYSAIQNPTPEPIPEFQYQGFINNFQDIFGGFNAVRKNYRPPKDVVVSISISFEESILGCRKQMSYQRNVKCDPCDGNGSLPDPANPPCSECNGTGTKQWAQSTMTFSRPCPKCQGQRAKGLPCRACNEKGSIPADVTFTVEVPPGVENGSRLRLGQAGHYYKHPVFNKDTFLDASLNVTVSQHSKFRRSGFDVVSDINISLIDAVEGKTINTQTAHGDVEIKVKPKSKNKDEIVIPNHGINQTNGAHRFIINVDYPNDTAALIAALKTLGS